MRLVQCFYCGVPGDWRTFDTEVDYQSSPDAPTEKKLQTMAVCDLDLERRGAPPLPKRKG